LPNRPSNASSALEPSSINEPTRLSEQNQGTKTKLQLELINEVLTAESELSKVKGVQERERYAIQVERHKLQMEFQNLQNKEPDHREQRDDLNKRIKDLEKAFGDLEQKHYFDLQKGECRDLRHRISFCNDELEKIKKGNLPKEENLTDLISTRINDLNGQLSAKNEEISQSNLSKEGKEAEKEKFKKGYNLMAAFFKEEITRLTSKPVIRMDLGTALQDSRYGRVVRANMQKDPLGPGPNFVPLMLQKSKAMLQGQQPQTVEEVQAELIKGNFLPNQSARSRNAM